MSTLRRRYERLCKSDAIEDCTHKHRYEASYQSIRMFAHSGDSVKVLQQNTWIHDRKSLISCVRAGAEQDNINHPAYGTCTADFMLRQNESRAFLGKYLNDPRMSWRHERRKMMAIAGIVQVAKWLAQIKRRSDVGCRLCKRAREQRRCEHSKFARRDVWAHQQCLLRWNGDNRHCCPPLHLEIFIHSCMPACKLHKQQRVSSELSQLIKRVV